MRNPTGSIKTLFIACIVVITGVLLTAQTMINVSQFQEGMEAQVKAGLGQQAEAIAGKLDQRLLQVERKSMGLGLAASQVKTYDMDVL